MKNINDRYVIFSIILVVFLFLSATQTLTSGYHFVDDHEVIRIKHDLKESSLIDVAKAWVKDDINDASRFRPLYFAHRVLETRVFGSDFFIWSLYTGLLWCLTLVLFYLGMRNLKFRIIESIIFLVVAFIGPQTEIWWRLGPQESLGVTFLAFSFYFMSVSAIGRNYHLNNILFIVFLILASLCKESFIIIIPAFLVFKVWYERVNLWKSNKKVLLKNLVLLVPFFAAIFEIIYIKYFVGTVYSGINNELNVVFGNIWHTCLNFVKTYLNLVIVGIILLITSMLIKKRIRRFDFMAFIFLLLILIPNIFLYARTGLSERYLLPSSIGLAFFIVACLKDISDNPMWYKKAANALILISFLPFLISAINDAARFAKEGKETNSLLSAISSSYETGTQALVVADPVRSYETSVSLKYYLFYENNIDLFGYCMIETAEDGAIGYTDGWKSYFSGKLYENMNSKPGLLIFLDSKIADKFFEGGPLIQSDYFPVESGSYTYSLFKLK